MTLTIGMRELATEHLQSGVANTASALVQLLGLASASQSAARSRRTGSATSPRRPVPACSACSSEPRSRRGARVHRDAARRAPDARRDGRRHGLAVERERGRGARLFGDEAAVFVAASWSASPAASSGVACAARRSSSSFPACSCSCPAAPASTASLQLLSDQTVSGITAAFDTFVTAMSIAYGLMVSTVILPRRASTQLSLAAPRVELLTRPPRRRRGRRHRAVHPRVGPVPDDAGQLGDERLDRDRREGRRHDGDRASRGRSPPTRW